MINEISSFFSRIISRGLCGRQSYTEFCEKAEEQQGALSSHIKLFLRDHLWSLNLSQNDVFQRAAQKNSALGEGDIG